MRSDPTVKVLVSVRKVMEMTREEFQVLLTAVKAGDITAFREITQIDDDGSFEVAEL